MPTSMHGAPSRSSFPARDLYPEFKLPTAVARRVTPSRRTVIGVSLRTNVDGRSWPRAPFLLAVPLVCRIIAVFSIYVALFFYGVSSINRNFKVCTMSATQNGMNTEIHDPLPGPAVRVVRKRVSPLMLMAFARSPKRFCRFWSPRWDGPLTGRKKKLANTRSHHFVDVIERVIGPERTDGNRKVQLLKRGIG